MVLVGQNYLSSQSLFFFSFSLKSPLTGTRPILVKLLQLGAFVVLIDEYMSSQCCAIDGAKMQLIKESAPMRAVCDACLNDANDALKRRFDANIITTARSCLWPPSVRRLQRRACQAAWQFFCTTTAAMSERAEQETSADKAKAAPADKNDSDCEPEEKQVDFEINSSK